MKPIRPFACVGFVTLSAIFTVVLAAPPTEQKTRSGNSYYSHTKALSVDDSGVVEIPSRYKWNVETSIAGYDIQGNPLPDSRILLRLHDPQEPYFTAFIAQMDLATAAQLHHELGDLLVKKLRDPNFQHRPPYFDPERIPTGKFKGIDNDGKAIIDLVYPSPQAGTK